MTRKGLLGAEDISEDLNCTEGDLYQINMPHDEPRQTLQHRLAMKKNPKSHQLYS